MACGSIERLFELFKYDSIEGTMHWKVLVPGCRHKVGDSVVANQTKRTKYPSVRVDKQPVYVHVVAWCMDNECHVPDGFEIDHKDRDTWNFKANNLRAVSHSKNQENRIDSRNKHGEKGISFNKLKKKFAVDLRINGVRHQRSGISTLNDAIKIRDGFMNGLEKE